LVFVLSTAQLDDIIKNVLWCLYNRSPFIRINGDCESSG